MIHQADPTQCKQQCRIVRPLFEPAFGILQLPLDIVRLCLTVKCNELFIPGMLQACPDGRFGFIGGPGCGQSLRVLPDQSAYAFEIFRYALPDVFG